MAVVGAKGKMGSAVCRRLSGIYGIIEIDRQNSIDDAKGTDLVIDFASGASSVVSAKFCAENKIPLIVGSTGQSKEELSEIEKCGKTVPILICKNFSVGIFLLKKIIDVVYQFVAPEVTIFEKHHSEKRDSPSGTALDLMDCLKTYTNSSVPILSERGGKEIGTHRLDFYFGSELISVSHQAFSREVFADGVAISTEFMLSVTAPGLYPFEKILESRFNLPKS